MWVWRGVESLENWSNYIPYLGVSMFKETLVSNTVQRQSERTAAGV